MLFFHTQLFLLVKRSKTPFKYRHKTRYNIFRRHFTILTKTSLLVHPETLHRVLGGSCSGVSWMDSLRYQTTVSIPVEPGNSCGALEPAMILLRDVIASARRAGLAQPHSIDIQLAAIHNAVRAATTLNPPQGLSRKIFRA